MSTNRLMMVAAIIVSLQLSACGQKDTPYKFIEPAHVEHIEGSDMVRVIFDAKAVERTGLEVGRVTEERVSRERTFSGQVIAGEGLVSSGAVVEVSDRGDAKGYASSRTAEVYEPQPGKPHFKGTAIPGRTLTFSVPAANGALTPGAAVAVDLALATTQRKVVPYASIIYDPHGDTWVYTNPEPLVFVRAPIAVDYIEGDKVVLHDGPPAGTAVVTTGALEVYGTEFSVGH